MYRRAALEILHCVDPERIGGWDVYRECREFMVRNKTIEKYRVELLLEIAKELRLAEGSDKVEVYDTH